MGRCVCVCCLFFFFFNGTATTEVYTLSRHGALPIWTRGGLRLGLCVLECMCVCVCRLCVPSVFMCAECVCLFRVCVCSECVCVQSVCLCVCACVNSVWSVCLHRVGFHCTSASDRASETRRHVDLSSSSSPHGFSSTSSATPYVLHRNPSSWWQEVWICRSLPLGWCHTHTHVHTQMLILTHTRGHTRVHAGTAPPAGVSSGSAPVRH